MTRLWLLPLLLCVAAGVNPPLPARAETPIGEVHYSRLANGLQLVVVVRHELQLVAVNTTVNLGAIDDPPGQWGIAHLLEHVTLQGSTSVGSLNPTAEAAAVDELDRAYAAVDRQRRQEVADPGILAGLERWFEEAQEAATKQAEAGEILGGRLEAHGAIGLNATTTADSTQFFTWIPPESVDLWLSLEAERLQHPVFRRFYSERSIVLKEVSALTGGRWTLAERFLQDVFPGSAAAHPLAGDLDQISAITRPEAMAYFKRFYRPDNIVIAIVGDVDPHRMLELCERSFGGWVQDGGHELPRSRLYQPPPFKDIRARGFDTSQGVAMYVAVPRSRDDPFEDAVAEALAATISMPEISPLYRDLVQRGLASTVQALPHYPSQKQTQIFLLQVRGMPGVSGAVLAKDTLSALRTLSATSDEDLRAGIFAAEMRLASKLADVPTLASLVAFHQAVHADWQVPFRQLELLRKLGPDALRRAARALFSDPNIGPAASTER